MKKKIQDQKKKTQTYMNQNFIFKPYLCSMFFVHSLKGKKA